MPNETLLVLSTFPEAEMAERIASELVSAKLAACANILGPCHSIYRWQGEVEEAGEVAALFKTRVGRADELIERLAELHSYDVPAAVVWPIAAALDGYRQWVESESAKVI